VSTRRAVPRTGAIHAETMLLPGSASRLAQALRGLDSITHGMRESLWRVAPDSLARSPMLRRGRWHHFRIASRNARSQRLPGAPRPAHPDGARLRPLPSHPSTRGEGPGPPAIARAAWGAQLRGGGDRDPHPPTPRRPRRRLRRRTSRRGLFAPARAGRRGLAGGVSSDGAGAALCRGSCHARRRSRAAPTLGHAHPRGVRAHRGARGGVEHPTRHPERPRASLGHAAAVWR